MNNNVQVVRCGDCRNFDITGYDPDIYGIHELDIGYCKHWRRDTQACNFCSFGNEKDNKSMKGESV